MYRALILLITTLAPSLAYAQPPPLNAGPTQITGPLTVTTSSILGGSLTTLATPSLSACYIGNCPLPPRIPQRTVVLVQAQSGDPAVSLADRVLSVGFYVNTGGGGHSPIGQYPAAYIATAQGPNGGTAWAFNTEILRNITPNGWSGQVGSGFPGTPGAMASGVGSIGYEADISNYDKDCSPGQCFMVDYFGSAQGYFPIMAFMYFGDHPLSSPANFGAHNGLFFNTTTVVKDNIILDNANSQYGYQATGDRTATPGGGSTFYANDVATRALLIQGTHTRDIELDDNANTAIQFTGTYALSALDLTTATVNTAIAMAGGQNVCWSGVRACMRYNPGGGFTQLAYIDGAGNPAMQIKDGGDLNANRSLSANSIRSGGSYVVCESNAAVSYGASSGEANIATCTVPAGLMTANSSVRVTMLWSHTNSATAKVLLARMDATSGGTSGEACSNVSVTTTATTQAQCTIKNANSLSAQKAWQATNASPWGTSAFALSSGTVNTANVFYIDFNGSITAASGDAITLESYLVEILSPGG